MLPYLRDATVTAPPLQDAVQTPLAQITSTLESWNGLGSGSVVEIGVGRLQEHLL